MSKPLNSLLEAVFSRKGRWATFAVWVLLAAGLSAVFPNVNQVTDNGAANLPMDAMSVQADKVNAEQFPDNTGIPALLVWYRGGGLTEQDYRSITDLYQHLEKNPLSAQRFIPPLAKLPPEALKASASQDGTSIVTPVFMKPDASTDALSASLKELEDDISTRQSKALFDSKVTDPGLHVRITGPAGIATDAAALFGKADVTLLISTVLLVLLLLILLYRSPILVVVPLIGVGFAYGVTGPILGLLAKEGVITVDSQAISIMTVLLFGAGTDYCLFLVSKFRETLLVESDKFKALQLAIRQSGGAIGVSAITVVLSLSALLLAQYGSFRRFAVPFSLVILIMGIAAVTLLPALLAILGRISFFPFIPRTEEMLLSLEQKKQRKLRRYKAHGRFSKRLGELVASKPWTVILLSVVVLGGLAGFSPSVQYTQNLIESFPKDMPSREGFDLMAEHFSSGELAPVQVIVNTEGKSVPLKEALSKLPFVEQTAGPESGQSENYESYSVTLNQNPYDSKSVETIPAIQNQVSRTLADAGIQPDGHFWIGGETSKLYDTEKATGHDMKVIIPVVILIIAVLLLLYLRSVIAMIYLILSVVLSFLSALGAGWLLIRYGLHMPAISGLIPLYAFVFLVALGEDYNIFMVSSIWKNRRTQPHREAIANGVSETSSVITSAGLILAGTFAVLATLPIQVLLQFGIVTAIGVLLDTFVVRPLLVPAITTVLGRYAFWPGALWKENKKAKPMNE
ncbi:MMPL family transporter [Paenibacillus humicola]|uniref:MMPL family transporter n=1 Tax=Paenibacillus humicola TaxID=3110540 RepID=UPI00237C48E0|nr:MMPL family transporter [Paenibacillus humicola]